MLACGEKNVLLPVKRKIFLLACGERCTSLTFEKYKNLPMEKCMPIWRERYYFSVGDLKKHENNQPCGILIGGSD